MHNRVRGTVSARRGTIADRVPYMRELEAKYRLGRNLHNFPIIIPRSLRADLILRSSEARAILYGTVALGDPRGKNAHILNSE